MRGWLVGLALLALAAPAGAAVKIASQQGFEVAREAEVKAAPAQVYKALVDVGAWWSPAHSFTGDAHNLSIDPRPGGCFCEKFPGGGGAVHSTVVNAAPGKMLRLRGSLGPLQAEAVEGPLTWTIAPSGTGSKISVVYSVGGRFGDNWAIWAPAVDGVIGEQLTRLARYLDTGSPAAPKP